MNNPARQSRIFAGMYWIKTPWWLPHLFNKNLLWRLPKTAPPTVYLTFDDGPHPTATPFALQALETAQAKGTFFCIGKNVTAYPTIFKDIITAGHKIGNHTQNHLNGWHTNNDCYLDDILEATQYIDSRLFRPPYGRIKRQQAHRLLKSKKAWKIIMWDVLSGDFDTEISPEKCLQHVIKNIRPGSIVVFHDSAKAWDRMSYALPRVLEFIQEKGWVCSAIG